MRGAFLFLFMAQEFGYHCCTRDTLRKIQASGYIRGPVWFFKDIAKVRRFQRMRKKRTVCLRFPAPKDGKPAEHYRTTEHGIFRKPNPVNLADCELI